jgi:hypothetical protein
MNPLFFKQIVKKMGVDFNKNVFYLKVNFHFEAQP